MKNTVEAFILLGRVFSEVSKELSGSKSTAQDLSDTVSLFVKEYRGAVRLNPFFDAQSLALALDNWSKLLSEEALTSWVGSYDMKPTTHAKTVALVMAGNIPLVGFHDFLAVLISGHRVLIRETKMDRKLYFPIRAFLVQSAPEFEGRIRFLEGVLTGFDAIIATGSNNTYRYFEHYFSKYPSILRRHRNSVAVLGGLEDGADLHLLGRDVTDYYGMGCRSVSKVFLPRGYEVSQILDHFPDAQRFLNNSKYMNNYRYQKACYSLNGDAFLDNGFLLLKESEEWHSSIGVLHYEYYDDRAVLQRRIFEQRDQLQCVLSTVGSEMDRLYISLGTSQNPALSQYADGKDTLQFLDQL